MGCSFPPLLSPISLACPIFSWRMSSANQIACLLSQLAMHLHSQQDVIPCSHLVASPRFFASTVEILSLIYGALTRFCFPALPTLNDESATDSQFTSSPHMVQSCTVASLLTAPSWLPTCQYVYVCVKKARKNNLRLSLIICPWNGKLLTSKLVAQRTDVPACP